MSRNAVRHDSLLLSSAKAPKNAKTKPWPVGSTEPLCYCMIRYDGRMDQEQVMKQEAIILYMYSSSNSALML